MRFQQIWVVHYYNSARINRPIDDKPIEAESCIISESGVLSFYSFSSKTASPVLVISFNSGEWISCILQNDKDAAEYRSGSRIYNPMQEED